MARKPIVTSEVFTDSGVKPRKLTADELGKRFNVGDATPKALGESAELERDAYRPSVTPAELADIRQSIDDARRVSTGRLFTLDLPKAVKRYARGFTKDERETLRTDALMLLIRWQSSGTVNPVPLGAEGETPYRRDWLNADGTLSNAAWRAMHAAIKQAARSAEIRASETVAAIEAPTDDVALGEIAEREADAKRDRTPMPELRAELIADAMGLTLSAGRALLFHAYSMSVSDAADAWQVTRATVPSIVSRGMSALAKRYPEASALIQALQDVRRAALQVESVLSADCAHALQEYAATSSDDARQTAERVAIEWRSVARMMPESRRVLIGATRRVCATESEARLLASALPMIVRSAQAHERKRATSRAASQVLTGPMMHTGAGKVGR